MSGALIMITAGATPFSSERAGRESHDPSAIAGSSSQTPACEWLVREPRYAAQAVANAERGQREHVERRLDKPTGRWTSAEISRSYRADASGERRFREEADVLRLHRYVGWLETGRPGQPLAARVRVDMQLGAFAPRDWWQRSPRRTVTWVRQTPLAAGTV